MFVVRRSQHNPVLVPNKNNYWEEFASFNLCPIKVKNKIYGLYRAISAVDEMREQKQISTIGIAESKDGIHFEKRRQFIIPEKEWEQHGCEDPRITYFEGKFYIFYTAISKYPIGSEGIKVAVAISKDLKKIEEKHFVTPFNAKAMTLFPKRINGKIFVIFSAQTDIPPAKTAFAYLDKIEELWSPLFWEKWNENIDDNILKIERNKYDHIEIGAPPLLTEHGWLLIYSHIQNYFPNPNNFSPIFGIEALLLDLKNPQKIIGKTKGPLIAPEEFYELSGYISNVIFPSGALIQKNRNFKSFSFTGKKEKKNFLEQEETIFIYYGAADTTACLAYVNLKDLIYSIHPKYQESFYFKRSEKNPIIMPKEENSWESQAVFNPAAISIYNKIYILYRALSKDNTSVIGYAMTQNGIDIIERLPDPVYIPREDFEKKKIINANSGCEDPRLTKIGKNIYICYTAFDGIGPPRVALSFISEKNFLSKNFIWEKPFLITPYNLDDKDTCILPKKFKNGYFVLHRVDNEICGDYLSSLKPGVAMVNKCIRIIGPRRNMWDSLKVGIASPPIYTKYGWLVLYHGVSKSHNSYRIGAILLSLKDPVIVLARSTDPIFEPEEEYEKIGIVNNVVFPCGAIVKGDLLYIYYGGADRVVGVATMKLNVILKALARNIKIS